MGAMQPLTNRCNMESIRYSIADPRALMENTTYHLINPLAVKHLMLNMGWVLRRESKTYTTQVSGKDRVMRQVREVTGP